MITPAFLEKSCGNIQPEMCQEKEKEEGYVRRQPSGKAKGAFGIRKRSPKESLGKFENRASGVNSLRREAKSTRSYHERREH